MAPGVYAIYKWYMALIKWRALLKAKISK